MNPRHRKLFRWILGVSLFAVAVSLLLQIDLVDQNLEIAWIQITGRQWHLRGTSSTVEFWSNSLRQRRKLIVYLPPGYYAGQNHSQRYAVLYLLHGSPDPGNGWSRYGRAPELVDRLITLYNYPPLIVVLPDGNGQGTFGDSEFIDAPATQKSGRPGLKMGTYITRDIVEWIDAKYRTIPTAEGRLIGGISTGGYGAANLGLQNPGEFGTVLSFSGYYRADPTGWARPVWGYHPSEELLRSQSPMDFISNDSSKWKDTLVIIGDGAGDRPYYRNESNAFYAKLISVHIKAVKLEYPGRHSWDLWRALLTKSLRIVRERIPADTT
jgi:enterochelin esterase-like enzyme